MAERNGRSDMSTFQQTKSKLANDPRLVAEDAEELMKSTSGEIAEKKREVRERLRVALEDARKTCAQLEEQAEEGIRAADQIVRENPDRAIGVAVGAGFLIGLLLKRRS